MSWWPEAAPRPATPPVVIGGTGGSGTRVVAAVLRGRGWYLGAELNEFGDALPLARFDWRRGPSLVGGSAAGAETLDEFGRALAEHLAGGPSPALRWGWKHPHSYLLLPFLDDVVPGMRFVHVIRDGRDMALSANRRQLQLYGPVAFGRETRDDAVEAIRFWAWANERAAADGLALGARYHRLRLEDLCDDPAATVGSLLEFLGESDDMGHDAPGVARPAGLGRWRDASAGLVAMLEHVGGDALARFGYASAGQVAEPRP